MPLSLSSITDIQAILAICLDFKWEHTVTHQFTGMALFHVNNSNKKYIKQSKYLIHSHSISSQPPQNLWEMQAPFWNKEHLWIIVYENQLSLPCLFIIFPFCLKVSADPNWLRLHGLLIIFLSLSKSIGWSNKNINTNKDSTSVYC